MTTLGKILVVVNFVFALVTGFLIITVFTVRTNWKASYDRVERYYKVSQANVQTYHDELNSIKNASDTEIKNLKKQVDDLTKEKNLYQNKEAMLTKQLTEEQGKVQQAEANAKASSDELGRAREQVKIVLADSELKDKRIVAIETKNVELRDKFSRADVAARTANQQARSLIEQLEDSYRELERLKTGAPARVGGQAVASRPPPEDVQGVVVETDNKSDLVTISIGSDAGVSRGNTLEIFRLQPEPKYLGKLRILDVTPHAAVGRPMTGSQTRLIQKGDTVAANVLGRR